MERGVELMNVTYKRDVQGHSLVIQSERKENNYCLNMLLNNRIKGILHLEVRMIDNIYYYYYEITGHEDLSSLLQKKQLQYSQIKSVILNIIKAILNGKEYLLLEQDFILDPRYIYVNAETYEVLLCYYIGYDEEIMEQISSVIEFLMNIVDYKDEKAVLLIYGLYKISKEEGITFSRLTEFIEKRYIESPDINKEKKEDKSLIINSNINGKGYQNNKNTQQEKVYSDKEVLEYPIKIKIILILISVLGFGVLASCFYFGLLYDSIGNRIDTTKVFGMVLMTGTIVAYAYGKLLNKENRIAVIKEKIEYVNKQPALGGKDNKDRENKTQLLVSGREDKTTFLEDHVMNCPWKGYELVPVNTLEYKTIELMEVPLFIGNTGEKRAGTIENDVISRYHAKIDYREGQFYLVDLNSTNGTYINYNRIEPNEAKSLSTQDEVMFANISYVFQKA